MSSETIEADYSLVSLGGVTAVTMKYMVPAGVLQYDIVLQNSETSLTSLILGAFVQEEAGVF
jgi:hypothetical protein